MKTHKVEFCAINLGTHSYKVKSIIEKEPDVEVITFGCLKNCSNCFKQQYAKVNGEIVTGDTPELLIENIFQRMKNPATHS